MDAIPDIDPLWVLTSMSWFIIGWLTAKGGSKFRFNKKVVTEVNKRVDQKVLDASKPICGCDHSISYHVDHVGKCKLEEYNFTSNCYERCDCQKYAGPEPLPQYTVGD